MKRIILVVAALFLVIIGMSVGLWFIQNKPVQFTLNGSGYTVEILNDRDKTLQPLTSSRTIRLSEGKYSYKVIGNDYDNSANQFTVKGSDTTVSVTPKRSVSYLTQLLDTERGAIETALKNNTPTVTYTVSSLSLYEQGEWAAGRLQLSGNPRQLRDTYRFILKKQGESWTVVVSPRIVVEVSEFSSVPKDIIYSLYSAN